MADNIIIPSSEVKGDITSCKIDKQIVSIERKSVFSISQKVNYITYDVCNKQQISSYSVPEFTGNILLVLGVGFVAFWIVIITFINKY